MAKAVKQPEGDGRSEAIKKINQTQEKQWEEREKEKAAAKPEKEGQRKTPPR